MLYHHKDGEKWPSDKVKSFSRILLILLLIACFYNCAAAKEDEKKDEEVKEETEQLDPNDVQSLL